MIVNELNLFLSNLNVLYRKIQNYHWNIKGNDFFEVHTKLEEYYDAINEEIDEIAEHILSLDGEPLGTLKDYIENTQIAEAKNEKICSKEVFQNVLNDFNIILENARKIKETADNDNQYATSALMDEYLENYQKKTWMIKQLLIN